MRLKLKPGSASTHGLRACKNCETLVCDEIFGGQGTSLSCEAGSARTHVTNLLGAGYELVPGGRIQMMCHAEEGKGLAGPTC